MDPASYHRPLHSAMVDWSSLPSELLIHIADCLLATNDVDCYMHFRAVRTSWRSATDDPRSTDHSDLRFHPRRWIILDEVFQTDARLMVNTATGRVLRKDLPVLRLRKYEVTATTPCGFLVLTDREHPHAARVLNPFTGRMIRFMAQMPFEMGVSAAAISGDASPELILFSDTCYEQYTATPDSDHVHLNELEFLFVWLRLAVGAGICTNATARRECDMQEGRLKVYYMDTDDHELEPVKSIGGRAIFVGCRRCLSVNAHKFSSIVPDCV
ncbi:hypothetical protein ZWY2020_000419 [Hordeum vulgare]|nr:hypothetical protein ZWY2020_000419 [Hordeum vulgare]